MADITPNNSKTKSKPEKEFCKSENLIILETKQMITRIINESNLPCSVMKMIINEIKMEVDAITQQSICEEVARYQDYLVSLEKNKKEGGSNGNK